MPGSADFVITQKMGTLLGSLYFVRICFCRNHSDVTTAVVVPCGVRRTPNIDIILIVLVIWSFDVYIFRSLLVLRDHD